MHFIYRTITLTIFSAFVMVKMISAKTEQIYQVSQNIYYFYDINYHDDLNFKDNFFGNSSFIVLDKNVIVIDPGISYQKAKLIYKEIKKKTDKPISKVIITHADQSFIFGTSFFKEMGVEVCAHNKTIDFIKKKCVKCLERLKKNHSHKFSNSTLVIPELDIFSKNCLNDISPELEIIHLGHTISEGSISLFHRQSKTLFSGGIISNKYIPDLRNSNFNNLLKALKKLKKIDIDNVIPSYGTFGNIKLIDKTLEYLTDLDELTYNLYEKNIGLIETLERSRLEAYEDYTNYSVYHRSNVMHRYIEIEKNDFD